MEFLVFIIYGVIISEWIFGKGSSSSVSAPNKGRSYYKSSGILNMIVGFIGMMIINMFLRDKDIIPVWSVWVGMIGFIFMSLLGMFHIYKMMTTLNP